MNSTIDYCGIIPDRYEAIIKLLKKVSHENDIINPNFEITKGCDKGDGFLGEKHAAVLNGDNKSMKVFIKGAPTSESLKKFNEGETRYYFLIEIIFYDYIYPTFWKFQEERHVAQPFNKVLNCLATTNKMDHEILVLPDARERGFTLWDRQKQMNKSHVEIIFKEYGKFHACSFALKDQQPEVFQELVGRLPKDALGKVGASISAGLTRIVDNAKEYFDPVEEADMLAKFTVFSGYMMEVFETTLVTDGYSVLTHGDCWCNNIMFKYPPNSDKSAPIDICLIDFQLARLGSPVMDLSYFLYSSASASVYANLDNLLRIYHKSLSDHIRALGSDPDVLYPFSVLKQQWLDHCNFGVIMALIMMKIVLMEKDEAVDLNEVLDHGDDVMEGFTGENKNDAVFYQRVKELVKHLAENGLFKKMDDKGGGP